MSARYRRVPVIGPKGKVVMQRVRSDRLEREYGRVQVNARGKLAYTRKPSEVRALEIVRGSTRRLRRVRLVAKDRYERQSFRKGKSDRGSVRAELHLTVVVPDGEVRDFKEALTEELQAALEEAGLPPFEIAWGTTRNEPVPMGIVGVEESSVFMHGRESSNMSQAVRYLAEGLLRGKAGEAPEYADEEAAQAIMRAERSGDRYRDPRTGRFTLNPEALK
jgi:hypothetical protein